MRPKLKSDTFFIPMGDSLYLRNNEKSMAIKGKALAGWLERLSPTLDGQHDLAEICQLFPEQKRSLLTQFLVTLVEHGYLKDTTHERPHTLSAQTLAAYAPAITFIDSHTDSGAYRFQRFLTLPVLVIASGECLLALTHTLLETGNRSISLLDTGEETTSAGRLQEILAVQQERDSNLHYTLLPQNIWQSEADLLRVCAAAHTVLYFSTADFPAQADRLARCCQTAGTSFLPAVVLHDEIHIGPFQHPNSSGCWQCYWRRYQAAHGLPASIEEHPSQMRTSINPGKPASGIVANMLAFEFFKYGTNVRKNTLDQTIRVLELERLQIVKHLLFPHPLCTCCGSSHTPLFTRAAALADISRQMQAQTPAGEPQNLENLIDSNSGIFTCLDDNDLYQLPLIRSQIEVTQASSTSYERPIVQAVGIDYAEVRQSLVRQAAGRYLASLADAGRACQGTYEQFQHEAVDPALISGWHRGEKQTHTDILTWVWGVQLTATADFVPVLLPGAAIAPYSSWNRNQHDLLFDPEAGVTSVAPSWQQALAEGLGQLCLSIPLEPTEQRAQWRQIAREAYATDTLCAAYLKMLDILGQRIVLVDCVSCSAIPHIAIYVEHRLIGFSAHWNTLCAVRQALQQAVLSVQIKRTPGPGDVQRQENEEKASMWKEQTWLQDIPATTRLRPALAEASDYTLAGRRLASCLRELGWEVAVASLSRDPALERSAPCALRVLAMRQESTETQ